MKLVPRTFCWLNTIYKSEIQTTYKVTCYIIKGLLNAKKISYSHRPPTRKCPKLILCRFLFQLLNIGCFSSCKLQVTLVIECFLFDAHTFLILSRIKWIHRPFNQGVKFWDSLLLLWYVCLAPFITSSIIPIFHITYAVETSCTIAISSMFIVGKLSFDWKILWYSRTLVIYYFRHFSQKRSTIFDIFDE